MEDKETNERYDRELGELLQELRVALPGVQVLFAFLLIVAFDARFAETNGVQRAAYLVALIAAVVTTLLLMTVPAFHRIRWRSYDKARLLELGNRFAVAGMASLLVAITSALFLVTDFVFGRGVSIAVASVTGGLGVALWFLVPLKRAATDGDGT